MFHKFVLSVFAILSVASVSFAQQTCSSDQHYWNLVKKYPQLEALQEQFDTQLDEQMNRHSTKRTTSAGDNTIYDIPIVVHVVHDYGAENLSDDALYTAAAYWAVVYMKQNADTSGVIPPFIPYIGNPNMRLHLATIDPNGRPTKGIDRVNSYLSNNADDQAKYNQWPQNEYVNIWLIGTFGAADVGVAAYAYFPSSAVYQPYYDGIISLASYASPTTKTIPHEMGHVLSLYHPWGNTNNPGVACGGTDKVDDTPPTKGHLPSGCGSAAIYDTACATGYMVHYTDIHGADSLVDYPDTTNAQNIMDYTYCQEMFTKGQAYRMRTALLNATAGRSNLITPANLALTGALAPMPDLPPVADYIMNKASGPGIVSDTRTYFMTANSGYNFLFRNASWNDTVSDVLWTFSNGATNPTSTSMTTVANQFTTPGWVTVSLVANSNAGTDTLVNTNAVYVADTTVAGTEGYTQQFASADSIANWPMFNYYNNQFKWEFYTGAGYGGDNTCVRYHSFDTSQRIFGTATGDHDDLYTPAFDLTGFSDNEYVNFFTSGATTSKGINFGDIIKDDSLEVYASASGGVRWTKIATYYGTDLGNAGNIGTDFVPSKASQWKARSVLIPATYRTNNTFLRFRYWPGNAGNNLYLDNFSVYQYPAEVKEALASARNSFNVFPNPASNGCTIVFNSGSEGNVAYCIKDITGKPVYESRGVFAPNSIQQVSVPRSVTPSAGMYFVTITIDGLNTTRKLVVY